LLRQDGDFSRIRGLPAWPMLAACPSAGLALQETDALAEIAGTPADVTGMQEHSRTVARKHRKPWFPFVRVNHNLHFANSNDLRKGEFACVYVFF
jgi:hypothetical protein